MRFAFVFVLFCIVSQLSAQKVEKYLFLGKEAEEAKDYYRAVEIYKEGTLVTTENPELNFHYAECLRILNDYELAEKFYQLTLAADSLNEYPVSLYWIATMQKNNGRYSEALSNWELLKRLHNNEPGSETYKKAQQEILACSAILKGEIPYYSYKIWNLESLNTSNAEFAANYYDSTGLVYSKLDKAGKKSKEVEFIELHSAIKNSGAWNQAADLPVTINKTGFQNANGSFSSDKKYFVFTRCEQEQACQLYIAIYKNGAYSEAYPLKLNVPFYTSTQPYLAKTDNGYVLYFASDRPGGKGGFDIWYSISDDKLNLGPAQNLSSINSPEDEITPFYYHPTKELFFSSTWYGGLGGMDIFKTTTYDLVKYSQPLNIGRPYNSQANDSYFTINAQGYRGLLTSNREGSVSGFGKTCCNDIYEFEYPVHLIEYATTHKFRTVEKTITEPTEKIKSLYAELSSLLPLTLYFHNDEPDPKSTRNFTMLNYQECYLDYFAVRHRYEEVDLAQSDRIYKELVQRGFDKLERYLEITSELMSFGAAIESDVKGYASPLAKSNYNIDLTSRRIESFINYLKVYKGGSLLPYLVARGNQPQIRIRKLPFGENKSATGVSDNYNDQDKSVYSFAAAKERRIEIIATRLIDAPTAIAQSLVVEKATTEKAAQKTSKKDQPIKISSDPASQAANSNQEKETVDVASTDQQISETKTPIEAVKKDTPTIEKSKDSSSSAIKTPAVTSERVPTTFEKPINPGKESGKTIKVTEKAAGPEPKEPKSEPVYYSNNITLNLGRIKRGELLVKKVKFRNAFGQNINFSKVQTDCSCTDLKVSTKLLVPEEETTFTLLFETRGKIGVQEGKATILTKDLKDNITINFKVEVIP